MPIRVQCQCGQSLNVPDQLAGKSGKCPKCGASIKIPGPTAPSGATASGAAEKQKGGTASPAKPDPGKPSATKAPANKSSSPKGEATKQSAPMGTSNKPAAPVAKAGLDDLFDQVGLVKKVGNFCPHCDARIAAGTALCVKCGFNFETGEKLSEHASESSRQEFENKHLNEAARMMRREDALELRTRNLGMPWWALLCIILVGAMVVVCGVMIVDSFQTGLKPANTIAGKVTRLPYLVLLATLTSIACVLIGTFAHFSIASHGFRNKAKHGWGSLLLPFYAMFYGLNQIKMIRGTVLAYWFAILFGVPAIIYAAMKLPSDFLRF